MKNIIFELMERVMADKLQDMIDRGKYFNNYRLMAKRRETEVIPFEIEKHTVNAKSRVLTARWTWNDV